MAVNLSKGQDVDLTKGNPALNKLLFVLGWDVSKYSGECSFDLDASAFLLGENDKVANAADCVFYDNLKHASGSVTHMGDNLSDEDTEERILIDLSKIPAEVEKIAFALTIFRADEREQNFGQVSGVSIRVLDEAKNAELIRYDLDEKLSVETAVVVGELYRYQGEWNFRAVEDGFKGGLSELRSHYGVNE